MLADLIPSDGYMPAMVESGNTTESEADDAASRPARMAFLALIMVVAGVGNFLLLYAIFQKKKLRQNVQNVIIVNLALVCLFDCFLNMSVVLGSLATDDWSFGDTLCRWHSFVMNLVLVETALMLTVLTSDRYFAIKFLKKYEVLISPVRLAFVITFTWLQSLAFSIPFLFDTVYTTFRPRLHTCSVSDQTSLTFLCFASVLCFLAPAIAILVILILIFHLAYKQRHEVRTLKTKTHYTDIVMEEPKLTREMWTVKMSAVLFLLWFILEVPYIVTTYIQQYRLSQELSFMVEYPWGVDVAFIWMRFSYSAIIPCAIFFWKRDLWQSVKECMTCHRNNSVIDIEISVKETSKPAVPREMSVPSIPSKSRDRDQKQEPTNMLSFNVPVLFATSDGIHIETPQSGRTESEWFYDEILSRTNLKGLPAALKGKQLDVGDSDEDDLPLPADTSDYDSSPEKVDFISSSLKTVQRAHNEPPDGGQQRPLQHPAHPNEEATASSERIDSGDLAETHGADSGLELSGTVGSSVGKGIRLLVESSQKLTGTEDRDQHWQTNCSVHERGEEGRVETEECPPILSPTTDVVPVWDTSATNTSAICDSSESKSNHTEQYTQQSLPIAPGRLKPLQSERRRKGKKAGQGKKKRSQAEAPVEAHPPDHHVTSLSDGQQREVTDSGQNRNAAPKTSSRGARGHKRTKTSDSQKSLLGSNSSVEMQSLKAQSQLVTSGDSADSGGKNEQTRESATF